MARLILILLLSIIGISAQCQLTFSASNLIQDPGDEFFVEIKAVQGFDSIAAVQLTMQWDQTVIEFLDIDTFGLPLGSSVINDHFNYSYLSSGYLPFVWDPGTGGTVDKPNNTTLLRFKFKAIGPPSSSTLYQFNDSITAISALAGYDYHTIDFNFESGEIKLTPVMALQGIEGLSEMTVSPNPSSEDIKVRFFLNQPTTMIWALTDLLGKELTTGQFAQASGSQIIKIDREVFPETGIYLFSMRSAQGVLTRKLIIQQ